MPFLQQEALAQYPPKQREMTGVLSLMRIYVSKKVKAGRHLSGTVFFILSRHEATMTKWAVIPSSRISTGKSRGAAH